MKRILVIAIFITTIVNSNFVIAQNDSIYLDVQLDIVDQSLKIKQQITYYNTSKDTLSSIFLHNWPNAFSDKNTHLGKRFIEDYKKKFFFTSDKNRGATLINNIAVNYQATEWQPKNSFEDYIEVSLNKPLQPKGSVIIDLTYTVKIPSAKFTSYGCDTTTYNLRYWYLVPVVYDDKWHLMHHLDMDDLYQNPTNYTVNFSVPENYNLVSNLKVTKKDATHYTLNGTGINDFEVHLSTDSIFNFFQTDQLEIVTNLNTIEIGKSVKKDILNRQIQFIESFLGSFPQEKIFLNKTTYEKNPLYGFNQLPGFLRPFSDTLEWDLRMFKTLVKYYVANKQNTDTRQDTWLYEGVQSYLMMQYVTTYYPEIKLIGGISDIWGVRSYHLATLDFNDRYNYGYQYAARRNKDQPLSTPTDSLTNFNRLIGAKYKAAIGLRYLGDYVGDSIVQNAIKKHFSQTKRKLDKDFFQRYLENKTQKDLNWFFKDYLQSDKKIDYTIKRIKKVGDSIAVTVKNKRNFTVPISLYCLQKDSVLSKTWLVGVDSLQTNLFPKNHSERWVLNYEKKIPEINLRDNWEKTNWSFLKRPLRIRLFRDTEDANHAQLFVEPKYAYNFYDGFILAATLSNKNFLDKNFEYAITPSYGLKSKSLTGHFKAVYWKYLENKTVNSFRIGLVGSYYHYQPELTYKTFTPYAQLFFKRKNLRSVKSSSASVNYAMVNRDIDPLDLENINPDKYQVFRLAYVYSNPEIINDFWFETNLEFGSKYSKLATDVRFSKLTNSKRHFSARLFAGIFLNNQTNTDFFSYGVNRPNDYLFRYRYLGRSETSGLLSQQIIISEGGFKSQMPVAYANQWLTSFNTSIGLWRWFEIYNDVGLAKNQNRSVFFIHDKGVRLNFVNNIFEVYFPLHSSNGWEIAQPHYEKRIRFVFTSDLKSISNFLKRGFM